MSPGPGEFAPARAQIAAGSTQSLEECAVAQSATLAGEHRHVMPRVENRVATTDIILVPLWRSSIAGEAESTAGVDFNHVCLQCFMEAHKVAPYRLGSDRDR
jgi:hypothetical protein